MSVYTNLTTEDLNKILKRYDIGNSRSFVGISDGITNTNFYLTTSKGEYIITIFEDIGKTKVKKYLELMSFFSNCGLCSPEIQRTNNSEYLSFYKNKPLAIMQKLQGKTVKSSNNKLCDSLGNIVSKFHNESINYKKKISNSRDIKWVDKSINKISNHITNEQRKMLNKARNIFKRFFDYKLPSGVIHSDLFMDNVLASNTRVLGIIDYYYSFNGPFIYELAVIINDWCTKKDGSIDYDKYSKFMYSYNSTRPLSEKEIKYLNNALVSAALRFYLSRLVDMIFPKVGEITHIKDPSIFEKILSNRLNLV